MTITPIAAGFYFPENSSRFSGISTATTLNAANDKSAFIGHVYWEGRAASKVISSAGGQVVYYTGGSQGFVSGSSTVSVGIQDVDAVNGPVVRPDGTFDTKVVLTGGVDTIPDTTWKTCSMSTGSKTIAHGDLVAVVVEMTTRGGTDQIQTTSNSGPSGSLSQRPTMTQFKSSAWSNLGERPQCYLVADDGTLGHFDGGLPITNGTSAESWSDATNPDERGIIFQVPWGCNIDAFFAVLAGNNSVNSDATWTLYSDPTGTPIAVSGATVNLLGENFTNTSAQWFQVLLPAEVSLSPNTDYCLALKGAGSATIALNYFTLPNENIRKFITGGTTLKKATRNNGAGAFSAESPAITMYQMGVRISSFYPSEVSGPIGRVVSLQRGTPF